jgi:hypothetical protein
MFNQIILLIFIWHFVPVTVLHILCHYNMVFKMNVSAYCTQTLSLGLLLKLLFQLNMYANICVCVCVRARAKHVHTV